MNDKILFFNLFSFKSCMMNDKSIISISIFIVFMTLFNKKGNYIEDFEIKMSYLSICIAVISFFCFYGLVLPIKPHCRLIP